MAQRCLSLCGPMASARSFCTLALSRRHIRESVVVRVGNAEKSEGQYLQGKVALITGGSGTYHAKFSLKETPASLAGTICLTAPVTGGIGSSIAKRFASKGATLALVGKEAKECEEVEF